jgi:hypothetical protein
VPEAPYRLAFEAFGVAVEAGCEDRLLFERLPSLLPPGWRPSQAETPTRFTVSAAGVISRDGTRVGHADPADEPLEDRFGAAIRRHVAEHAPAHVFLHAGVVAVGGTAIVVAGESHSGKTTLVRALLARGATYYSDEYAVIDAQGAIEPYSKPLAVRVGAQGFGVPLPVPPERVADARARAGLIVLTRYVEGASWQPRSISSARAVLLLLGHTIPARSRPSQALEAVTGLVAGAVTLSGQRGAAGEAADELLARLEAVR